MRRVLAAAGVLLLAAAGPARFAAGQSLAESAEKQKKARKGQAKVFTEEDLKNAKARVVVPPAADEGPAKAPGGAAPGPAKAEKTEEEQRAEKKAEIEQKLDEQRQRIEQLRAGIHEAQRELNDLGTYTFGERRGSLVKTIEDGQGQIQQAEQAIADLQEEARRQGLPIAR